MEIKQYQNEHKSGVVELILHIQQAEFAIPITLEDQPDLSDIDNFYQRGIGNFWVAIVDNSVAGTIALLDIGDANVALRKMFVKKEFRGGEHQVAYHLLRVAEDRAVNKGTRHIYLGTTEKFLAAHRFYHKHGYSEIRKEALPGSFPVMDVDKKFYEKTL